MKYKELRLTIFHGIFILLTSSSGLYFILQDDIARGLIAFFICLMSLQMVILKNNLKVFDDSCIIFIFAGIGILPRMLEFSDIKEVKLISKHRIDITHAKLNKIYIIDAKAFYAELTQKMDVYKKCCR